MNLYYGVFMNYLSSDYIFIIILLQQAKPTIFGSAHEHNIIYRYFYLTVKSTKSTNLSRREHVIANFCGIEVLLHSFVY